MTAATNGIHQRALTVSAPTGGDVMHGNGVGGEQNDDAQQEPAEQDHDRGVSETRARVREVEPQRPQDAGPYHTDEQQESPEAEPYLPDRPQRRDEDDEDHQLDDQRPNIERREPAERAFGRTSTTTKEDQRRSAGRCAGGEKQRAEPGAVSPDRTVGDREQDAGVTRHEESEQSSSRSDQFGECPAFPAVPREEGAYAEQHQAPHAERNRRPALEHQIRKIVRLEHHVPKAERPPEIERQYGH